MKKSLRILFLFIAIVARMSAAAAQEDSVSSRYPIIAAYIYNFTQFTTWPSGAVSDSFFVCVTGTNPFGSSLAALRARTVAGKKIVTKLHPSSGELPTCNVLFIADSERGRIDEIVKMLKGAPVLTMSDIEGFAGRGGMVEFQKNDEKVGIRIDLRKVQDTGLAISSKLLRIADTGG